MLQNNTQSLLHIYPYFINAKKKNVVVIKCLKKISIFEIVNL